MTGWSLVLYRIIAVACWWAAACLLAWAAMTDTRWIALAVFVAGVLMIGVGRGIWKGERA